MGGGPEGLSPMDRISLFLAQMGMAQTLAGPNPVDAMERIKRAAEGQTLREELKEDDRYRQLMQPPKYEVRDL